MTVTVRILSLCTLVCPVAALAAPEPVQSQVESVGLFKNGLFVVRETIPISGAGTYHLDTIPKAIHGTLWFESDALFEARLVTRAEERPAFSPRSMVEAANRYPGRTLHLEMHDGKRLAGVLVPQPARDPSPPPPPTHVRSYYSPFAMPSEAPEPTENIITLRTSAGLEHITANSVRSILLPDLPDQEMPSATRTVTIPSLELVVREAAGEDATITMTYLSNGMAWAPSYRIEYDANGSVMVGMSTIVRNEWRDLAGTRVDLISGFPQIEYAAVTSPLWHEMTLESFFTQLSGLSSPRGGAPIMSQMVMTNVAMPAGGGLPELSGSMAGAGEDLHFLDMGPTTLGRGSAVTRHLASASASATRFVEWRIKDDRDDFGRWDGREREHDAWDSIRFNNPFDFAMTTAPASVWIEGRFRGQSTATFTNPGAEAVVRTTKALSVETRHEESDLERGDIRRIAHSDYQPVVVRAEMTVTNRRNVTTRVEVVREFQGTLREVSEEPAKVLTVSRRNAVNPNNEARWILELPAGEERVVTLDYEVLVRI